MVFSSPDLVLNATYVVYRNGVQSVTFTTNSIVTTPEVVPEDGSPEEDSQEEDSQEAVGDGSQAARMVITSRCQLNR